MTDSCKNLIIDAWNGGRLTKFEIRIILEKELTVSTISFPAKYETIEAIRVTTDCLFRRTFAAENLKSNGYGIRNIE